jgi:hypothetical protein
MCRLLLLACVLAFAAGCEEKAPTQAKGKVDTIHTTGGTTP